ncbi:MAG: hypothetical protein K8R68_11160, partial [Bacteroidales bacterium]|nr:hypothetical protein [Bacteroidales bacterium]
GPSTQAIIDEANKRIIPYFRMDEYNLVQLGTGKYQKSIRATITSDTNLIAVETAGNEILSNHILNQAGIPVPETIGAVEIDDIITFHTKLNKPVFIKMFNGSPGKIFTNNIKTINEIESDFLLAQKSGINIIAQQFVQGDAFRLLIIDYKFAAACKLEPSYIIGDGKNTISQLIEGLNNNQEREYGDKGKLSKIDIDDETKSILKKNGYKINSILPESEKLILKYSGNPKKGGISTDVTDKVHPFNIFIAERAAKIIGLNIAGIDIIAPDIDKPITENNGAIIKVNAAPDFRMHISPASGISRNVAASLLNMLFPEKTKTHIPLISITGSSGKTITADLLNYCFKEEGLKTGLTTSDGLYIGGNCLKKGNMTFPEHAQIVLKDPTIDFAIVETSCEGILKKGLGYEFADVGIFLNISEKHIGENDIRYIEDLAYAKSVVAEQVYENGYTILNADNPLVIDVFNRLYSKLILFSKSSNNIEVKKHINNCGMAVYIKEEGIVINLNKKEFKLVLLSEIPLYANCKSELVTEPLLAVVATLMSFNIKQERIMRYILEFEPNSH